MHKWNFETGIPDENMCAKMREFLLFVICSMFLLFPCSEEFCGRPHFKPTFVTPGRALNRISNGIEARMHSLPWQALVIINNPEGHIICGGSLIDWKQENASDLILTAAHCLVDWEQYQKANSTWEKMKNFFKRLFAKSHCLPLAEPRNVIVYLGAHDLKRPTRILQRRKADRMTAADFNSSARTDDIALIKLKEKVAYNIAIQGVCLPAENEGLPPPESPCLVAGWGRLRNGERGTKLQQFQTYIIEGKVVNPYYREDRMICTASNLKYTGARKGDSGGPLVCLRNGSFVVYGVVSFGFRTSCYDWTDRQAFTKVTRYLPWLKNAIAKMSA